MKLKQNRLRQMAQAILTFEMTDSHNIRNRCNNSANDQRVEQGKFVETNNSNY